MNTSLTYDSVKRGIDIAGAMLGISILSPVMVVSAIVVRASSPGPALYRQVRMGRGGRPFTLLKFRSMSVASEGASITASGDARVTKAGRVLRRYKLDELPQLFNVLNGDMSLVGPRPELQKYVQLFPREYTRILAVRPGITDYAAVEYRDEEAVLAQSADPEQMYIGEVLPAKIRLYFKYIEDISLRTDISLITKTLWMVIR